MKLFVRFSACVFFLALFGFPAVALAQTSTLRGQVTDPSGAVVPGATISLTNGTQTLNTKSGADGRYAFRSLTAGSWVVTATAKGFATVTRPDISLAEGEARELNLPLSIAVESEEVLVTGQNQSVSISPDQNSNSMSVKGSDLDALSDDPDELQNELQALAGPAAGPNGGQIYIDGFEGGQIPPKSAILEVRVNQNPFSAEYDRIGYGRIEIITKPGSQKKLKGSVTSFGNSSYFNTANPLIKQQPDYYLYSYSGEVSGRITKTSSFSFDGFYINQQKSAIVDALDPAALTRNIGVAFPAPVISMNFNSRVDFQINKNNFASIRDSFSRTSLQGNGVGALSLPDQASSLLNHSNELQIGDTWIVNPRLLLETRFMWRRIGNYQAASVFTPTVTVQGAFTTGGNNSGIVQDHQDIFTLQQYGTATLAKHTLRFGARVRSYRDANFSTSGANGYYFFSNVAAYQAGTPAKYSAAVISNPVARLLLFDGSFFIQDDWRVTPRLLLGLGARYEGQNFINDHADWAPRIALAWTPDRPGKNPPKTVVRAGYGWFYNRFTVPTQFSAAGGAPYVITAIHDNRINQKSYTLLNPGFYDPNAPATPAVLASAPASVPTYHTVDPHFRASLDMQAGIGVDHQIAKHVTGNISYLYTQGVHQYLSNNVTAPTFDEASYAVVGSTPALYNYQFQSGGFYRQNQLILSSALQLKKFTLSGNYVLNQAKSDTQGVNSFPSIAQKPGFDYGRASFGMRHRLLLLESYTAPHGFVIASLFAAQSGTPYNLTIGEDLTGNNQFNARPAFETCGAAGVITTQYGCLDTNPTGKNEPIIPYGLGTGPVNAVYHVRISKVIGIGPRLKSEGEGQTFTPDGNGVSGRGIGNGGPAIRLDAAAPRRYNLTIIVGANNALNMVNRGTPNGVLLSPLFNQTQSLANGQYGSPVPGNRSVFLQSKFTF